MELPRTPDYLSPALEGDVDRVMRCRLKAEEYRTLLEQTHNATARDTFRKLAELAEQMAAAAQARVDAHRAIERRFKKPD